MPFLYSIALLSIFALSSIPEALAEDWPQWRGPTRDGTWRETGVVESFPSESLERVWQVEISNGYAGPTVADGRVYVTDRLLEPEEAERVLCFDAATGDALWGYTYACQYRNVGYGDGPRASVTIADGRAYAIGTMGHLHCFDAATGEVLWKKEPGPEYDINVPTWGIASAPLVEGDLLIVQAGAVPGGCLVAFDRVTGEERWRALDEPASYAAPIVVERAGRRILICWTGESLTGLNPATGEVLWREPTPSERIMSNIATPAVSGDYIFLTCYFEGSRLFKMAPDGQSIEHIYTLAGPNPKQSKALHSVISTPIIEGDHIYGFDSEGELRCLVLESGERVWESLEAVPKDRWATVHMVKNGDRIWMFNDVGELIIAGLSPEGFTEHSRAQLISPTPGQLERGDTGVSWSHPAYANRHVYARNDNELICVNLAAE